MNTMDFVSGAMYPLALALANPITAEWELVYDDSQSVIFLRRPPPDIPALSNKLGRVLRHMDRECVAYVENSPDTPLCAGTLAAYWLQNQSWDAARRMLVCTSRTRSGATNGRNARFRIWMPPTRRLRDSLTAALQRSPISFSEETGVGK